MFATIRDLGEVADVWVQFDPSFMEINQGNTERDSAFLKRKRVIFRQEEAILAQVERETILPCGIQRGNSLERRSANSYSRNMQS